MLKVLKVFKFKISKIFWKKVKTPKTSWKISKRHPEFTLPVWFWLDQHPSVLHIRHQTRRSPLGLKSGLSWSAFRHNFIQDHKFFSNISSFYLNQTVHGENLELSLKDREPVNVYVTILFLKDSIRVISAKWLPLKWWSHITWRQGQAHCTMWEELSHHRELVPSPPHESSLYSASWYKILFFLRNYNQLVVNHLWQCCSNCFMIGSHPKVLKKH